MSILWAGEQLVAEGGKKGEEKGERKGRKGEEKKRKGKEGGEFRKSSMVLHCISYS